MTSNIRFLNISQRLAAKTYYVCLNNIHCASEVVYDIMSRKVTIERKEVKAKYDNSPSEFKEIIRHRYSREVEFSPIIQISLAL
ncbi:hypothetical protein V1477_002181 [Vespula maculifrons]|uniref:Uncharacterized protein n=1 Tax=Vespula maculifrons TaxID=7453 RepID=A0ABD2CVV9_VESMC